MNVFSNDIYNYLICEFVCTAHLSFLHVVAINELVFKLGQIYCLGILECNSKKLNLISFVETPSSKKKKKKKKKEEEEVQEPVEEEILEGRLFSHGLLHTIKCPNNGSLDYYLVFRYKIH